MIRHMKPIAILGAVAALLFLVACASGDSFLESKSSNESLGFGGSGAWATSAPAAPAPPMAPAPEPFPGMPAAPAPSMPSGDFGFDEADGARGPAGAPGFPGGPGEQSGVFGEEGSSTEQQATLVAQQRIIVRTVDMQLVVSDVSKSVDDVADLAKDFGGWVINSDRSSKHFGSISLRVPAPRLDEAILTLRGMAVEVDSETSTSRDVTDEYVDIQSRLTSLQATEGALLKLLERAETVEEALNVQRELARLQADIESMLGRIKLLEETAAFSLISVHLRLAPVEMSVDAGEDRTFSVRQFARFRATFQPPEDIEDFFFTWDFGDGTPPVSGRGSAPTTEEGTRFTAVISHAYEDDRDSPYIVEVKITGTGDGGVTEGTDTFIATVTRLPTIEVFAGDSVSVEEGEDVEFEGSFTRPEGLTDMQYTWDFGDGSSPVVTTPEAGVTKAVASHVYADNRPFPYTATLTIKAQSEAGEIEASGDIGVFVTESKGLVVSGWSAGDTGKLATRTLSGVAIGLGTLLIWLAIFSPLWLVFGGGGMYLVRRARRNRRARASIADAANQTDAPNDENQVTE